MRERNCNRRESPWPTVATLLLLILVAAPAFAVEDPTYMALRAARPDGRQVSVAEPLILERAAFRFYFDSGVFHLLAPVDGRTVGAVFLGEGRFELHPASEDERQHLAFLTGRDRLEILSDTFDALVMLFTDGTATELEQHGTVMTVPVDRRAVGEYEGYLRRQRKDARTNFHVRVLEDLLNTPGRPAGFFLAFVNGKELPPAVAAVDPRGAEALRIESLLGGEEVLLYSLGEVRNGPWYLSHRRPEVAAGRRTPYRPLVDVLHYEIDTEVRRNEDLLGTTTIRLRTLAPVRVVPLNLLSTLRIQGAEVRPAGTETWAAVPFIQEEEKEDADAAVVLPEVVPEGRELELRLRYEGDEVIFDLGDEIFAVGARASWYPNASIFLDPATFDLTFRVPKAYEVVAVGKLLSREIEGRSEVTTWKTEKPIRVAGFNYGEFTRIDRRDEVSGLGVHVYAQEEAISFRGRSVQSEIADAIVNPVDLGGSTVATGTLGPQTGRLDPAKLAEGVAVDAVNAARLFHTYFGPLPYDEVAITQQANFLFGQSWPALIFMPYEAFMTGTARNTLGLSWVERFEEAVGFHEMAHQWWGHLVGWQSYRDQWLSEGFSDFSAALVLQYTEGWERYVEFWDDAREQILSRGASTVPAYQVGPLTRGRRLATAKSRDAYSVLVYRKGGFVLHMLRMLMWDPTSPEPDRHFIDLMQDFTSTFAGRAASTEDFKAVAERHMVPALNATGDGKLDWFFGQWVYGTEVPRLTANLEVMKAGQGGAWITGEVTVAEVPDDFRLLVPLYLQFGKDELARVGLLPFVGPGKRRVDLKLQVPKRPRRALINARHEVLARR